MFAANTGVPYVLRHQFRNPEVLFQYLTVFLETEFGSWMDRWHAERWHGNGDVVGANGLPIGLELPGVVECEPWIGARTCF